MQQFHGRHLRQVTILVKQWHWHQIMSQETSFLLVPPRSHIQQLILTVTRLPLHSKWLWQASITGNLVKEKISSINCLSLWSWRSFVFVLHFILFCFCIIQLYFATSHGSSARSWHLVLKAYSVISYRRTQFFFKILISCICSFPLRSTFPQRN